MKIGNIADTAMTANLGDETDDGVERCPDCDTSDYHALDYDCDCKRCEDCCDCKEEETKEDE